MVVNGVCTIAVCIVLGGVARFGTLLALRATNTVANLAFTILKHTEACRVSPVIQLPAVEMGSL